MSSFRIPIIHVLVSLLGVTCSSAQSGNASAKSNSARDHVQRGGVFFRNKQYELAVKSYDRALNLDGKLVSAYVKRGRCSHELRNFKGAVADFSEALRRDPKNSEAYRLRGRARLARSTAIRRDSEKAPAAADFGVVSSPLAKADIQRAVDDFEKAVQLDPRNPDNFIGRGMARFQLGLNGEAIKDYTRAIDLKPKGASAYFYRAMARARVEEFKSALNDLDTVIRIEGDHDGTSRAMVYPMRAGILIAMRRFDDALADSEKLIELRPKAPGGYSLRAVIWSLKGDQDNVLKVLSRGINAVPTKDSGSLYLLRAKLREGNREFRLALADYKAAAKLRGKDADVACNRTAFILATCEDEKVRNYDEAIIFARLAHQLSKRDKWKATAMVATAYAQAGKFTDAVKWQEEAIEKAPATAIFGLKNRLKLYRAGKSYYDRQ